MSRSENNPGEQISQDQYLEDSYEIIRPIGRGRNSVVYLARPLSNPELSLAYPHLAERLVALKVLIGSAKHPELNVRRMKREALAMLSCLHPNVIKLSDYLARGDVCYLAMEYADCGDLRVALDGTAAGLPLDMVIDYSLQVLAGLEAIHRAGIIHRDIKPENLLLNSRSEIKIADFGISFLPTEKVQLEEANRGIGTFDYLAPECLEDGISNEATDVYSTAVTMFQLATREMPFSGESFSEQIENKMRGEVVEIAKYAVDVPPLLQEFFNYLLSPDPGDRPASAAELREVLQAYRRGEWMPPVAERKSRPSFAIVRDDTEAETVDADYADGDRAPDSLHARWRGIVARVRRGLPLPARAKRPRGTGLHWSRPTRLIALAVSVLLLAFFAREKILHSAAEIFPAMKSEPGSMAKNRDAESGAATDEPAGQDAATDAENPGLAALEEESRRGLVYGLLADQDQIPLYSIPSRNRRSVIIGLAIDGWRPQVVEIEELRGKDTFTLLGSGLVVSLAVAGQAADSANEGKLFRGTYQEQVSGRRGTWVLW